MKSSSVRKFARRISLCVALIVIALFFTFGGTILDVLRRTERGLRFSLGERLTAKYDLVFLADLEDSIPRDIVSQMPLTICNAPRIHGRFGYARRINLDLRSQIHFPVSQFIVKTNEATFAAWFKPTDINRHQTLFEQKSPNGVFTLNLSENELIFSGSDNWTNLMMKCGFNGRKDVYTHIALVIRDEDVSIWQNGRKTGELALIRPLTFYTTLLPAGATSHWSFEGDIDDIAIWKRALSPNEIKSLACSSKSIRKKYDSVFSGIVDITTWSARFLAGLYRSVDRLAPPLLNSAQTDKKIRKMTVWPTKNDSRHFLFAHEESLECGFRTSKAAAFRSVNISFGNKTIKAEIALDDVYGRSDAKRMAFIVKDPSHTMFDGCGVVRIYPPELHEALHNDASYPLPLSGDFIRLFLADSFKGLYLIEKFDRTGSAWMARGIHDKNCKRALYYHSRPAPCDITPPGITPEKAFSKTASLVLSDPQFPWSKQEVSTRKKALDRQRIDAGFDTAPESDKLLQHIIANNPSPMFVTNNLAFDIPGLRWESSDQSLVTTGGNVIRPPKGAPRPVTLTPVDSAGTRGTPRRIRVVPVAADLQTLFIYIGFPTEKHRRTDFVCYRVPAGDGTPEWLTGIGNSNSGIKHRGNTSYVRGAKRSFSLEFDNKVNWPGSSRPAQHVLLFSGYADPTRLRNKVAFDSFRNAAQEDIPCGIVDISWSEVFINGEYFGVWETCRRTKDICPPKTPLFKVRAMNTDLWKTPLSDMTECVSAHNPHSNPYRPLEDLFEFTSGTSGEEFADCIDNVFHLDSIIDYYLMLNFTQNRDGQVTNQYIAKRKKEDKWFIIPWDYDKSFLNTDSGLLSNYLTARMITDVPDFKNRLSDKWKTLRAGSMSDNAVLRRIEEDAALLAPYMAEEYRLLQPAGWKEDFPSAVNELKQVVADRLKMMDARFGSHTN